MCGGGEGEGEGKVVEQQTGALGNPRSSFSSSSFSLCVRRGFDIIFTLGSAVHSVLDFKNFLNLFKNKKFYYVAAKNGSSKNYFPSPLLVLLLDLPRSGVQDPG